MSSIDVNRLSRIDRVHIIGTCGSGKSTFGRQFAAHLKIPFVEMDSLYWGPNWTEHADEEFLANVKSITDRARWVLDGNYTRTTPVKWRQVQLVIWLDISFMRTVFRVSTRCVKRALGKTEIWPGTGNRETLRKSFFSRQSVILWSITSYSRNRKMYSEIMESQEYDHVWFVRLRSKREVRSFLETARVAAEQSDARGTSDLTYKNGKTTTAAR